MDTSKLIVEDYVMPQELVDSMVAIQGYSQDQVRAIDERVFRENFLELLTNTSEAQPTAGWLQVAGSPYNPVNVVKDGKLLFVVPPLVRPHPTHTNTSRIDNCNVIAIEFKQYLARHPNMGMAYMSKALGSKLKLSGVDMEYIAQWNKVLEYYGKPIIELPKNFNPEKEAEVVPEHHFDDNDFEEC